MHRTFSEWIDKPEKAFACCGGRGNVLLRSSFRTEVLTGLQAVGLVVSLFRVVSEAESSFDEATPPSWPAAPNDRPMKGQSLATSPNGTLLSHQAILRTSQRVGWDVHWNCIAVHVLLSPNFAFFSPLLRRWIPRVLPKNALHTHLSVSESASWGTPSCNIHEIM